MQSDDEPPAENKGRVIPIQGSRESAIPTLINICAKSIVEIPLHIKYPTLSLALRPVERTLRTRIKRSSITST